MIHNLANILSVSVIAQPTPNDYNLTWREGVWGVIGGWEGDVPPKNDKKIVTYMHFVTMYFTFRGISPNDYTLQQAMGKGQMPL